MDVSYGGQPDGCGNWAEDNTCLQLRYVHPHLPFIYLSPSLPSSLSLPPLSLPLPTHLSIQPSISSSLSLSPSLTLPLYEYNIYT